MNSYKQAPEENNGIYKVLITLSFIMLSSLTWSSAPLQKAIEGVTSKYQIKAKAKVCAEVLAHEDVYIEHTRAMFISGCLTTTRQYLKDIADGDKKRLDEITSIFEEQNSLEFDRYSKFCQATASEYERQGNITNKIIMSLWETLQCEKIDKKMIVEEQSK